jgi:hypothetical protein
MHNWLLTTNKEIEMKRFSVLLLFILLVSVSAFTVSAQVEIGDDTFTDASALADMSSAISVWGIDTPDVLYHASVGTNMDSQEYYCIVENLFEENIHGRLGANYTQAPVAPEHNDFLTEHDFQTQTQLQGARWYFRARATYNI